MQSFLAARSTNSATRPRLLAQVTLLGFASGLPLALTGSTLQAWLTAEGVDLVTLGALSLVGLPYLYKFLWAPLLDRLPARGLGRRRTVLVVTQFLLAMLCVGLSFCDPNLDLSRVVALVALLAVVSATQDIVVDAWRAEALSREDRGLGAGLAVAGYRVAMVVSGAGVLLLADQAGFRPALQALAGLLGLLAIASLLAPEPPPPTRTDLPLLAGIADSVRALWQVPGIWQLLAFIALYKLGDAFAGSLTMSFLLRAKGFTLTEIGGTYKLLGMGASIAGGVLGGLWLPRLGLWRALGIFGLIQAVTNAGFLWLALMPPSFMGMVLVVGLENLSAGMGTSALVALMVGLCQREHTATHFALLSALASLGRVLIGPLAGGVAAWSWSGFFALSMLFAGPGLWLWWRARAALTRLDAA